MNKSVRELTGASLVLLLVLSVTGPSAFATFALKDLVVTVPNGARSGTDQEPGLLDPGRSGLMQEQFDAVLVLGKPLK
jgi:hypothetical protein